MTLSLRSRCTLGIPRASISSREHRSYQMYGSCWKTRPPSPFGLLVLLAQTTWTPGLGTFAILASQTCLSLRMSFSGCPTHSHLPFLPRCPVLGREGVGDSALWGRRQAGSVRMEMATIYWTSTYHIRHCFMHHSYIDSMKWDAISTQVSRES